MASFSGRRHGWLAGRAGGYCASLNYEVEWMAGGRRLLCFFHGSERMSSEISVASSMMVAS